ncbi:MAG: hypothetical protein R3C12_17320 [Planctomycetaceae bacterium]|nr:hypothetical protein [Planctomycetaceae bacterium]
MRVLSGILVALLFSGLCTPSTALAKIEAVKGKQYTLTKKHGPWMVMVAVFSEPPEELKTEGLTPEQAAEELVYELRLKGIPAYTYRREMTYETVETVNRLQQSEKRKYKLDTEICVLAGNYQGPEADRELAKRTLAWVKEFQPKSLEQGGIYKQTPGQPGLLSGAFLTINPLLDPEVVKKNQRDPELIRYNRHYDHSLLDNPGKYTVTVASFYPNSVTLIGSGGNSSKKLSDKGGFAEAADQAWQVTRALRERNIEAYVFHDHKRSIVTVGSFESTSDPRIEEIRKMFGARLVPDPTTGQSQLIGEVIVLPSQDGQWMCTFDPNPETIEVPFRK